MKTGTSERSKNQILLIASHLNLGNKTESGTLEVQVLGSVDVLGNRLGVHLERVRVGGVARDDHVVPLVVVQLVVAVPLEQAGPIPQVKDVVDEPGGRCQGPE